MMNSKKNIYNIKIKFDSNLLNKVNILYDLRNYFKKNNFTFIKCAIVHGSVATNEIIRYSDFDGLLIIKDHKLKDKTNLLKYKKLLKDTLKIIYNFDPLQHHGWFIIYESQLKNYPQTYFPYELFNYARVIYPEHDIEFNICIPEDVDYILPFKKLSNSILTKLQRGYRPKNMYQLKGLLSEFMLLPSLYIQAKEKRGVFKKYSFELAKRDFLKDEWEIMDKISKIRINWNYKINFLQKFLFTYLPKRIKKYYVKYVSVPIIPYNLKVQLTNDFYKEMFNFIIIMKNKLMINN